MIVIKNVNLETVAGITSTLPINEKLEFAFAGKSNVGKSSLINALMNRKSYARTSATPGKTQTINYYNINDEFYLVDLPGYGYAKASKSEQGAWAKMIDKYLDGSGALKQVFLLVDIRHEPGEHDKQMHKWILAKGFTPIVIATKLDKLKRSQIPAAIKTIRNGLSMKAEDVLIPFSAETKAGRDEIYAIVEEELRGEEL